MTDQEQTNAMADILGKLNAAESGTFKIAPGVSSSADDAAAMHDVLAKLQEATNGAAYEMVNESQQDLELATAVNTQRNEQGVSVSRYDIRTEKKTVSEGLKKTFYYVVDNQTGRIVHDDLGLFESAMGIVKHMLYTKKQNKIDRIVELDQAYVGYVVETYGYKTRLTRLDESEVQYDVASAKYSNSKSKMQQAKMLLLKAL